MNYKINNSQLQALHFCFKLQQLMLKKSIVLCEIAIWCSVNYCTCEKCTVTCNLGDYVIYYALISISGGQ